MVNVLSTQEEQIVDVLRKKFDPQAIVLVGSRANDTATVESDWDVFLFCGKRRAGIELAENGLKIDVNFSAWPKEEDYFDTGYGPVQPTKVLFDSSEGRLDNLLNKTETAYKKGPLKLQAEISALNIRSFERYLEKLRKYENDEITQFYYKGKFLDLFLIVWFEHQNMWAPSPRQALRRLEDSEGIELIQQFARSSGASTSTIAARLATELAAKSQS